MVACLSYLVAYTKAIGYKPMRADCGFEVGALDEWSFAR